MFKCSLLLPNSLAHAVQLYEAFLLFSNKFIEILQRADTSFLHEELYGRIERTVAAYQDKESILLPSLKQQQKPRFTREQLVAWISRFKYGQIIGAFVNSACVYDDRLVMTYRWSQQRRLSLRRQPSHARP